MVLHLYKQGWASDKHKAELNHVYDIKIFVKKQVCKTNVFHLTKNNETYNLTEQKTIHVT